MRAKHAAQIDGVEHIKFEAAKVVMDRCDQLIGLECREPRTTVPTNGTYFADDHQIVRIGIQRIANQFVGNVGTVIIAGIDVIDPAFDRCAQDRKCLGSILGRSVGHRSGKLHCAVTDTVDGAATQAETATLSDVGYDC